MTYPPNIVNPAPGFVQQPKAADVFYVSVDNTVYGPYSQDLMAQYVLEGRVGPQSLVSFMPTTGFRPAHTLNAFQSWQGQEAAATPVKPAALPSVFFIIADIHSGNHVTFLKTLQTLGKVQRLSDAVWIIAAQITIEVMRDLLSRNLTSEDRLYIHDSFSNRAGWFNIGEGLDDEIKALWNETAQQRKAMKET